MPHFLNNPEEGYGGIFNLAQRWHRCERVEAGAVEKLAAKKPATKKPTKK